MLAKNAGKVSVTLPSDREIRFTRVFDWPRELIFESWTNPEYLRHWFGCGTSKVTACEVDLRVGGAWRIRLEMPDGVEHLFRGTYREIVRPQRLVYSECYDMEFCGRPEWLTTVEFEDLAGRTRLTNTLLHKTRAARDGHLRSGMESGMEHAFDRLSQVASTLQIPEHTR
ncbi:MAG TPA: SRPBCC domain-containing protein [Bryobacteraceae bacterium]|jgi:uncharacterized protein YndB with AHSA1/START domain|nr:SRPBCC domain-containing protein [Bryobacteraceae bacterium]